MYVKVNELGHISQSLSGESNYKDRTIYLVFYTRH